MLCYDSDMARVLAKSKRGCVMIEAGSQTIRMKRGDIIEAMIEEGLDPDIAKRVFDRLIALDLEMQTLKHRLQSEMARVEIEVAAEQREAV